VSNSNDTTQLIATDSASAETKIVISRRHDTKYLMTTAQTLIINNTTYDCSNAIGYHYGRFPPPPVDVVSVFEALTNALQSLTRYDEKLKYLQNSELLLAPLRQRDAVVSSRMEGTISTLEEVLRLEASENAKRTEGTTRNETLEVALYARALRDAESQMLEGQRVSEALIRNAHKTLLSSGRGVNQRPGEYKNEQNYIGDKSQRRVDFIPIQPSDLPDGMRRLIDFIRHDNQHQLIRAAVAHAEFEALHPFEDGNGRSWASWCQFFLTGLAAQADKNMDTVNKIQNHYEVTKNRFREILRSQYFHAAVDYVFTHPVFWNNHFVETANGPKSTLRNFTSRLVQEGLIDTIVQPSGRAPGLYAYTSLLQILHDDS